jgi:hypothetical protein
MADTSQVVISGTDRTSLTFPGSITVQQRTNQRWTAGFRLGDVTGAYRPNVGEQVVIWGASLRLFSGTIDQVAEVRMARGPSRVEIWLDILCTDLSARLDQRVCDVPKTYKAVTAGSVILDVMANFATGEGVAFAAAGSGGYVSDGATVTKYVVDHQTVGQVIADMTALSGFVSFVSADGDLHHQVRNADAAPFAISDISHNWTGMTVTKTREDYYNESWTQLSWAAFTPTTEILHGNSSTRVFTLAHPAAQVDSIQLNGVDVAFGSATENYVWAAAEATITQDVSQTILTSGDNLVVVYRELGSDWIFANVSAEISARAGVEGNSGHYSRTFQQQDQTNATAAGADANAAVTLAAHIPVVGSVISLGFGPFPIHPRPGMVVTVGVTTPQIAGSFLIQDVAAQHIPGLGFQYTFTMLDGTRIGNWIDYFKALAGQGASSPTTASGTTTTGGGGAAPVPPNDSTITAFTLQQIHTSDGGLGHQFQLSITPPVTLGTFIGCHLYLEFPDQSAGSTFAVGTGALGTDGLQGTWAPLDLGLFPYDVTQQPWTVPVPAEVDLSTSVAARIYAPSYSTAIDNTLVRAGLAGASPNATMTVVAPVRVKQGSGSDVTPLLVTGVTATVLAAVSVSGKLKRPISVTVDFTGLPSVMPTNWAYQLLGFANNDLTTDPVLASGAFNYAGVIGSGPDGITVDHTFGPDEPTVITPITIYAVAGLKDLKTTIFKNQRGATATPGTFTANNIVPGITASVNISIGTTTGVTDPTKFITANVSPVFGNVGTLFDLLPLSVDNTRQGLLATATVNLQALAVTNPTLAGLAVAVGNLQALAVTNPKLATAAVAAANMAANSITAGNAAIAALAVVALNMAAGSITAANAALGNLAVGTANIQLGSITNALIANLAVGTAQIQDAAITAAKILTLAVSQITGFDGGAITITGVLNIGPTVIYGTSSSEYGTYGVTLYSPTIRADQFKVGTGRQIGVTENVTVSSGGGLWQLHFVAGIYTGHTVVG